MSTTAAKQRPEPSGWVGVFRTVGLLAGLFAAVTGALLALNHRQTVAADPLNSPVLLALVKQAQANPADTNLAAQVRAMDLLARQAFFSSQAFVRRGAALLAIGVALLLIAIKGAGWLQPRAGLPGAPATPETAEARARAARRAVAVFGLALTGGGLALGVWLGRDPSPPGASVPAEPAAAGDPHVQWPGFRGHRGAARPADSSYPVRWNGNTGEGVAWKTPLPLPGPNSPVVWGNRVFLTGADAQAREIYGFDAGSGAPLWRHAARDIPGSPARPPKVAEDTGLCASTAATDGQRVFAIFATGDLVACDLEGRRLWARNLGPPDNPYGYASSLLAHGGRLFVQYDQSDRQELLALDPATGRDLWRVGRPNMKPAWSSPVLAGDGASERLLVMGNPALIAYDPASGKERWRVEGFEAEIAVSPTAADGRVIAGAEYARMVGVDLATGRELWEVEEDLPEVACPVVVGELLFTPTSGGIVTCRETATGGKVWDHEFDEGFYASLLAAGGRVYATDFKGVTHVFKAARTYESVAENPLGEACVATPALAGGRIYVRGAGHLWAIGEPHDAR